MLRPAALLLVVAACTQTPPQPRAEAGAAPVPAAPSSEPSPPPASSSEPSAPPAPVAAPTDAPAPDAASESWWCTCYKRTDGAPVTSCRKNQSECKALETKAGHKGGSGIQAGSLTHRCRELRGEHPGDALGGRDGWQPSKKPGAWLHTSACALPGEPDAVIEGDDDEEFDLASQEQLGALKLGLGEAEVRQEFGAPAETSRPELWAATGEYNVSWRYPARGLEIGLSSVERSGPWTVNSVTATAPSELRTARGVGIGDSWAAVDAAYGKDRAPESDPDDRSVFIAGSVYGGLSFVFDERSGKVREIFLGASAE